METGTLSAVASVEVPPKSPMISETVMSENSVTEIRNNPQGSFPKSGVYPLRQQSQLISMMTTGEILAQLQEKLDAKAITKTAIAEAAGIGKNRVSELFGSGTGRRLLHDEAVKLVEAFQLEQPQTPRMQPVPAPIARLVVLYVAEELGVSLEDRAVQIAELAEDVRAFSEYVTDPQVRESLELAEHFFRVMRVRKPALQEAVRPGTDPHKAH